MYSYKSFESFTNMYVSLTYDGTQNPGYALRTKKKYTFWNEGRIRQIRSIPRKCLYISRSSCFGLLGPPLQTLSVFIYPIYIIIYITTVDIDWKKNAQNLLRLNLLDKLYKSRRLEGVYVEVVLH